jgi:hypothetical protein
MEITSARIVYDERKPIALEANDIEIRLRQDGDGEVVLNAEELTEIIALARMLGWDLGDEVQVGHGLL